MLIQVAGTFHLSRNETYNWQAQKEANIGAFQINTTTDVFDIDKRHSEPVILYTRQTRDMVDNQDIN